MNEKKYTKFRIQLGDRQPTEVQMIRPRTVEEFKKEYESTFLRHAPNVILKIEGVENKENTQCIRLLLGFLGSCEQHWGSKLLNYCAHCQEQNIPVQPTPKPQSFTKEDEIYAHGMGVRLA